MAALDPAAPLPPLREDLRIERRGTLAGGAPGWVIHDPLRHRYFEINHRVVSLLAQWSLGSLGALRAGVRRRHDDALSDAEMSALLGFLAHNQLLQSDGEALSRRGSERATWHWRRLAHGYLFFRIPLVRPQRFLDLTWPVVAPFFGRASGVVLLMIALLGLYLAGRQWEVFLDQARALWSLEGALAYALALIVVKSAHELGHAYQAVRRGVRVPVMGVAFMLLFPVLYTDVSDAWRLPRRRDKLMIDAGGVLVELGIAALATVLWAFLPDGGARSMMFVLATTSWVTSLAINLNPFMRFDGYYFLSDLTGIQNLQPRSFALGRWQLRRLLFATAEPPPERLASGRARFMIAYAWATWLYRLVLFFGIALLIYAKVFKALGIVLFLLEIALLIVRPIAREARLWIRMGPALWASPRTAVTAAVLGGLVALMLVPLPTKIRIPALLDADRTTLIYPPRAGRIGRVVAGPGREVAAGDLLFLLETEMIAYEIRQTELRLALLDLRASRIASSDSDRAQIRVTDRSRALEAERLAGQRRDLARAEIRAPHAGRVVDLAPGLHSGMWVARDQPLARILDDATLRVRGYVRETDLARLIPEAGGRFIPDHGPARAVAPGSLTPGRAPAAELSLPGLAQRDGGRISTIDGTDRSAGSVPDGTWYPVKAALAPSEHAAATGRGVLVIDGARESLAARALRRMAAVLVREMSF